MIRAWSHLSRLSSVAAAPSPVALSVALVLAGGSGCQRDAADRGAEGPPQAGIPTLTDLEAHRLCVACTGDGTAPDGRFVYWTRDSGVMRLDPSQASPTLVWSDLHRVLPESGWEEASGPVVSREGTLLAIAVDDELWIVDGESGERRMTLSGTSAGVPLDWIPGDRGLVVRNDSGLVSVSLETDTPMVLAPPGLRPRGGRVSPDGGFLAYEAVVGTTPSGTAEQGIHVVAIDGSWRALLIDTPGLEESPLWSADGRTIIYSSDRRETEDTEPSSYYGDLWAVDVEDGRVVGSPRRLVQVRNQHDWLAPRAMTADGRLFVARVRRVDDIYAVPIDPGTLEVRGEPSPLGAHPGMVRRSGTLSPDGTLLAFAVRGVLPGVRRWTPAIRDRAAGTDRFLDVPPDLGTDFYMPPQWSPDGRYLLYTGGRPLPGLVLVDLATDEIRWLVRGERPELIGGMGWLPEGHTAVYGRALPDSGSLSVGEIDVDSGIEREVWAGEVASFLTYSNHLSPDGRYVTLPRQTGLWSRSLWLLDLERGELRQLSNSPNAQFTFDEPFLAFNAWTPSGDEVITPAYENPYDDSERVNARPAQSVLHAIRVSDGSMRRLGEVSIEVGMGWWNRTRYFSFNPAADTLVFTDGGADDELWIIENFDQVLEQAGFTP